MLTLSARSQFPSRSISVSIVYPSTEIKYIEHTSPVAINIYNDRTIIIIFGKSVNAINIKSRDVANSFIEYFKLLWINN